MKWWTFRRKQFLFCSRALLPRRPQNSSGMILDKTAWQKADTLESGVASSTMVSYCGSSGGGSGATGWEAFLRFFGIFWEGFGREVGRDRGWAVCTLAL